MRRVAVTGMGVISALGHNAGEFRESLLAGKSGIAPLARIPTRNGKPIIMSDQLTQRVLNVIAATQRISPEKVTIESSFQELGIDSMDGINILFALENEFDITIPDEQAKSIRNVREMAEGIRKLVSASGSQAAEGE